MRDMDPAADMSASGRVARAGLAGFAVCGLHPKIFPIAIAAGHQIVQIANPASRAAAIAIFAAISVVPALLPAIIEMINPGAVVGIKRSYERIMAVHGRWITAVLLLGAGAFVAHEAWRALPIR
jgi:threonine/homoserine/homoserine lactone efflux protein